MEGFNCTGDQNTPAFAAYQSPFNAKFKITFAIAFTSTSTGSNPNAPIYG